MNAALPTGTKIVIEPVTRVEGHGKVTILLDEANQVVQARLHIVEFRGFERFIQGRPFWEVPVLVQRLCGICPVSHHLAAAKAADRIVGGEHLTPTALKMRRLMHYGQIFQSHALHFFHLCSPDLLFGFDADVATRNIVGVAARHPELAVQGVMMRKFGQEIIKATAGKKIHGTGAIPGGINKNLSIEERDFLLKDLEQMLTWARAALKLCKDFTLEHLKELAPFGAFDSNHLSLIRKDGELVPASWDEALDLVADRFRQAGENLLTLASGRLSNEDLFNLKTLADGLGGVAAALRVGGQFQHLLLWRRAVDGEPQNHLLKSRPGAGQVEFVGGVKRGAQVNVCVAQDYVVKVCKLHNLGKQSECGSDQEIFQRAGRFIFAAAGRRLVTREMIFADAPFEESVMLQPGGRPQGHGGAAGFLDVASPGFVVSVLGIGQVNPAFRFGHLYASAPQVEAPGLTQGAVINHPQSHEFADRRLY